jgi:hypothetical protein
LRLIFGHRTAGVVPLYVVIVLLGAVGAIELYFALAK